MATQMIDTSNFLGIKNATFKSTIYKLCLSRPSDYFELRQNLSDHLKTKMTENLYKEFYNIMLTGKDAAGNLIIMDPKAKGVALEPQIPLNKINSFALSAVATLSEIVDDLVEMLLPVSFDTIMSRQTTKEGLSANPQAAATP
jgi:hypothetical protein